MSNVRIDGGDEDGDGALLRIGELAKRSGVPAATLRAWERRYGIVDPERGESGYRLYSAADERRVRSMAQLVEAGVAPAEAAKRLRARAEAAVPAADPGSVGDDAEGLLDDLLRFDEDAADRRLDRAISSLSVETVLGDLVLPVLRELGERWERGDASVSQEHFASSVLRGRLLGLARGWGAGEGRLALLACPGGEHHDLGLIAFGLSLHRRGWRIAFLGADTPGEALLEAVARTGPDAVVLFTLDPDRLERMAPELAEIAGRSDVLLAGPGADPSVSSRLGAEVLTNGPVEAAALVAA